MLDAIHVVELQCQITEGSKLEIYFI